MKEITFVLVERGQLSRRQGFLETSWLDLERAAEGVTELLTVDEGYDPM